MAHLFGNLKFHQIIFYKIELGFPQELNDYFQRTGKNINLC